MATTPSVTQTPSPPEPRDVLDWMLARYLAAQQAAELPVTAGDFVHFVRTTMANEPMLRSWLNSNAMMLFIELEGKFLPFVAQDSPSAYDPNGITQRTIIDGTQPVGGFSHPGMAATVRGGDFGISVITPP